MNPVCVLFHRFGPYHWARLNAAGAVMPLLGLEAVSETSEYAWDKVGGPSSFRRVTLFPSGNDRPASRKELVSRIQKTLDDHQPAAVAVPGWSDPGALAALSWCLKNRKPSIVMSESQSSDEPRRFTKETLKKRVVAMYSTGLVGGSVHINYLESLGMQRVRIFNGYDVVDNAYFASHSDAARKNASVVRARLRLPESYFLASNRFIAKKNLPTLLRAFAQYRRAAGANPWKLVVLGDGPMRAALNLQISTLKLHDSVLLPGFKQYDELPAYYGLAGAFVHASLIEQWGLVVNEAMACGLPVLVSERCGCAPDLVIHGKNGYTFDPLDATGLTQLLLRIAGNECDLPRMGEASREIIARWAPQTFAANLKTATEVALEIPRPRAAMFNRVVLQALMRR